MKMDDMDMVNLLEIMELQRKTIESLMEVAFIQHDRLNKTIDAVIVLSDEQSARIDRLEAAIQDLSGLIAVKKEKG